MFTNGLEEVTVCVCVFECVCVCVCGVVSCVARDQKGKEPETSQDNAHMTVTHLYCNRRSRTLFRHIVYCQPCPFSYVRSQHALSPQTSVSVAHDSMSTSLQTAQSLFTRRAMSNTRKFPVVFPLFTSQSILFCMPHVCFLHTLASLCRQEVRPKTQGSFTFSWYYGMY